MALESRSVVAPVALVTGTSRGIGLHLAEHLLQAGYHVDGCSRSPGAIEHPHYHHHIVDVSRERDVKEMFRDIRQRRGGLQVAINNAAINPTLSLAVLTPFAKAEEALATNVLGTFIVCRESAKLMMRKQWGRIINLGSMAARHEVAGEALYTASKAAVNALTRVLAKELYPHGITCNVVAPAAIETTMTANINPVALQELLQRNAIPAFGRPADVSAAVDCLIRPDSSAITGQIIYLGGA
jgi:3-oxoacyl-[acyl-carrier protein] reductase